MAIIAGERPGIYSDYTLSGLISGERSGGSVGLVCKSSAGEPMKVYTVTRESEALQIFSEDQGDNRMMRMIRILLSGKTPIIYAVTITGAGADETEAYAEGFALLKEHGDITAVVCDSNAAAVHAKLRENVLDASQNRLERIGCVGGGKTAVEDCIGEAAALNCERMVYICQQAAVGEDKNACYLAAVIAAAVATAYDPSAPLSGSTAYGIDSVMNHYNENQLDVLIRGGVTLFETAAGESEIIRAVTTRTTTEGVLDSSYRELTTVLIIDNVLATIRAALKTRLKGAKNNQRNRASIATQTQLELQSKLDAGIIDSYEKPVVRADETDPSVCIVELDFAVTRGLNQIHISAHVKI